MGRKKKDSLTALNKRVILDAARELFLKNGVDKTSMDEIAKEADYSKSTIYVYFKSKDDILNHLTSDGMTLFKERMTALAEAHKNAVDFMFGICRLMVEFHDGHPF
jgi:AcrR family transcriptional regulator